MHTYIVALSLLLGCVTADNCSVEIISGTGWNTISQAANWYQINVTSDQEPVIDYNISIDTNAASASIPYLIADKRASRRFDEYWNVLGSGSIAPAQADVILASTSKPDLYHVSLDNEICEIANYVNMSQQSAEVESAINFVTSSNGELLGVDGRPLVMKGINWFGFEYSGHSMVDGLSFGSSSISQDFATIVYRQQLLGFNTVRLPFSFQNLFEGAVPQSWTIPCKTDNNDVVLMATMDPLSINAATNAPPPKSPAPVISGVCNSYLPSNTIIDRYLYVVRYFAANGFYVIVDNHLNVDPTAINNPQLWVDYWRRLAQLIAQDSQTAPYIILEILNEPDSYGIRWEGNNGKPAYGDLLLRAMDAIQSVSPGQPMMIEGTGQLGLGVNWGNGFATDSSIISSTGISDPNPFFSQVLTRQYVDQIIIAPHIYPPSVTGATAQSGQALWTLLSQSVGYLNQVGYCTSTNCHKFPIVLTETGCFLTDPRDLNFYNDLIPYIQNTGTAADGKHNAFAGSVWWAWNNNALDTGGLVSTDWTTILWPKIKFLESLMTLRPWYISSTLRTESSSGFDLTPAQTQLLATPLRGLEFNVTTLLDNDDKLYGDLLTLLQRWKLLGFNTILLPFSFEDLANVTYLEGLTRDCLAANETRIKASVQPSDLPSSLLNGYQLPKITNVTENMTLCNAYIKAGSTEDVFIGIVKLISDSDANVLLVNTDHDVALTDPVLWFTLWVRLAAKLPDGIILNPLDTRQIENISWISGQRLPGLSNLYATLLPALSSVSPDSLFSVMGVRGNDFLFAVDFFRKISSNPAVSNRTFALAGNSLELLSSNNTISCQGAQCGAFPLTFMLDASAPSILEQNITLRNSSWFARLSNPLSPDFVQVRNLQAAGLKPWYGASTAYNPTFTPATTEIRLGIEANEYDEFPCYANISMSFTSAQSPFKAVVDLSFNNALYTTIEPPYSASINFTDVLAIETVFGHSFDFVDGMLTVPFSRYHDILFPNMLNYQRLKFVVQLASSSLNVQKFNLNGLNCRLLMI